MSALHLLLIGGVLERARVCTICFNGSFNDDDDEDDDGRGGSSEKWFRNSLLFLNYYYYYYYCHSKSEINLLAYCIFCFLYIIIFLLIKTDTTDSESIFSYIIQLAIS